MRTLSVRPDLARGTLRYSRAPQGQTVDTARGEEPGKILHEVRPGELGDGGQSAYYGSADSTPLFLMALGEYLRLDGRPGVCSRAAAECRSGARLDGQLRRPGW